jgi:hypothetical protein
LEGEGGIGKLVSGELERRDKGEWVSVNKDFKRRRRKVRGWEGQGRVMGGKEGRIVNANNLRQPCPVG